MAADFDGDGLDDDVQSPGVPDRDDDNDKASDINDLCPYTANFNLSADYDLDGCDDTDEDLDDDNDGVADSAEPAISENWDLCGTVVDSNPVSSVLCVDADNDGIPDIVEAYEAEGCGELPDGTGAGQPDVVYAAAPDEAAMYLLTFDAFVAGEHHSLLYVTEDCGDMGDCGEGRDLLEDAGPMELPLAPETPAYLDGATSLDDASPLPLEGFTVNVALLTPCTAGAITPGCYGESCDVPLVLDPGALPAVASGDTSTMAKDYDWTLSNEVALAFVPDVSGTYEIAVSTASPTLVAAMYVVTSCEAPDTVTWGSASPADPVEVSLDAGSAYYLVLPHAIDTDAVQTTDIGTFELTLSLLP